MRKPPLQTAGGWRLMPLKILLREVPARLAQARAALATGDLGARQDAWLAVHALTGQCVFRDAGPLCEAAGRACEAAADALVGTLHVGVGSGPALLALDHAAAAFQAWVATGPTEEEAAGAWVDPGPPCATPGCAYVVFSRGLCRRCYDADQAGKPHCSAPGCARVAGKRWLCQQCYAADVRRRRTSGEPVGRWATPERSRP